MFWKALWCQSRLPSCSWVSVLLSWHVLSVQVQKKTTLLKAHVSRSGLPFCTPTYSKPKKEKRKTRLDGHRALSLPVNHGGGKRRVRHFSSSLYHLLRWLLCEWMSNTVEDTAVLLIFRAHPIQSKNIQGKKKKTGKSKIISYWKFY